MKRSVLFYGGLVLAVAAMGGYSYALSIQSSWESSGFKRYPPMGEFIDAGGGRRMRVWCEGVGGPGVVLEATGLAGADQFAKLIPELSHYTRVCAYDRAGMGYSDPLPGDAKLADYTTDLEHVAQRTGAPPWILVGGSFGGVVVQALARQHPEKVGALVLLDAVLPDAFSLMEAPWASLDSAMRKAELTAPSGMLRSKDPLHLGDTQDAWLIYRTSTWQAVRRFVSIRKEAKVLFDSAPPLPADLPMAVLRHTRVGDMMGPDFSMEESQKLEPQWVAAQEKFAAQSSKSRLVAVEGAGHLIVHDAAPVVQDNIVAMMHPAAARGDALAAPPDAGSVGAGSIDAGSVDAGSVDAGAAH